MTPMETGYRIRIYILTVLLLASFGVLMTRLYDFQIERRTEFLAKVPGHRTVTIREPGIRGEITDRNGIVLARNLRRYEISFNLEEIRDAWLAQHAEDRKLQRIRESGGIPRATEETDIVSILKDGPESTIERLRSLGLASNFKAGELRTHFITHKGLIPYSYRSDLTYEQFAKVAEHNLSLPGVHLGLRPVRQYPYGSLASHILGYMKQWEKGDIPENAAREFNHYVGDDKGIAGVEASMNDQLRGLEGRKSVVKDEKLRTLRMSDYSKPGAGAKVQLTIDARRQYLLENVLRRTGRAAGVIMDVRTGEVIAMASVPDYDPNAFFPSIDPARWKAYNENKRLSPFTNRAIASFTPGSTMKVPTAVAGALQGMASRSFSCEGFVAYGNHQVGCWLWNKSRGRHGSLTLSRAIQQSCNPYFNKLANTIGWKAMVEGCQLVGFGRRTGIELPREDPGILPGSRAWRSASPSAVMTPALTAFLSIGQGDTMVTPLQMCAMTACIANGGKYYQPRIIRRATSQTGKTIIQDMPKLVVDLTQSGVKPADLELIRKGMWMAVNQRGGTAGRVRMPKIEVAAKTGTAQTTDGGQKSNNSWLISFAPYNEPKYAVCVMVQNAGSGGAVCGPLVHLIYRGLFAADEGMKLPLKPQTEFPGNLNRYEEIQLPEDILAAIQLDPDSLADTGESGDEAGDLALPTLTTHIDTAHIPTPTLTPEIDAEGTVIPRATPVTEP